MSKCFDALTDNKYIKQRYILCLTTLLLLICSITAKSDDICSRHIGLTNETVNLFDDKGWTALAKTVFDYARVPANPDAPLNRECITSMKLLLNLGANPNQLSKNRFEISPFQDSYNRWVFEPVMDLFLSYGADINSYRGRAGHGFWVRIDKFSESAVEKYLEKGANPNLPITKDSNNYPLTSAVRAGNIEKVRSLLKFGADPNMNNPINDAISGSNLSIVNLLIKHGAFIKDRMLIGFTIRYESSLEIIKTLLDNGVYINETTHLGDTALHQAYFRLTKKPAMHKYIKYLVNHGADITIKNAAGKLPHEMYRELPDERLQKQLKMQ